MRTTFQFTPENLQEAYKLHFRKSSLLAGRSLQLFGFLLLWSGLIMIIAVKNQSNYLLNYGLVLNGILSIIFHYIQMKTLGKRMYKRYANFHEPFDYDITEEGIELIVDHKSNMMKWESFEKAIISEYIVMVYPNKNSFYYFMKANFNSDDFAELKKMVAEHVKVVR